MGDGMKCAGLGWQWMRRDGWQELGCDEDGMDEMGWVDGAEMGWDEMGWPAGALDQQVVSKK